MSSTTFVALATFLLVLPLSTALNCYTCGATGEGKGDSCNLDNVCESNYGTCYTVLYPNGTWNASCSTDMTGDWPADLVFGSSSSVCTHGDNKSAAVYCICNTELCNDKWPTSIAPILPAKRSQKPVTCNMCGYPRVDDLVAVTSVPCTGRYTSTCTGDFCVSAYDDGNGGENFSRFFCGDEWFSGKHPKALDGGCFTGDGPMGPVEYCVCREDDCNRPPETPGNSSVAGDSGDYNDTAGSSQPAPNNTWNTLFPNDYFDWLFGDSGTGTGGHTDYEGDYNDTSAPAESPVVSQPDMPAPPAKHKRLSSAVASRIIQFYETAAPEEKTFVRRVVKDLDEYLRKEQNGTHSNAEDGTMSASMR